MRFIRSIRHPLPVWRNHCSVVVVVGMDERLGRAVRTRGYQQLATVRSCAHRAKYREPPVWRKTYFVELGCFSIHNLLIIAAISSSHPRSPFPVSVTEIGDSSPVGSPRRPVAGTCEC